MKIFITGATGYIGSAIVNAFLKSGHQVTGLVRSAEKEAILRKAGAKAVIGNLRAASTYEEAACECDVLIHTGFEMAADGHEVDRQAVNTLLAAAGKTNRTKLFIYTSGVMVLGNTENKTANEDASTENAAAAVAWRPPHEQLVLKAANKMLVTAVVRPGMVYGGKRGIISQYFHSAQEKGAVAYIGDGENRWPLVHVDDLAQLYLLIAQKRKGGIFHGVDGGAVKVKELARAVSEVAGKAGAVQSIPLEEARKQMGPFADAMCLDQLVGCKHAQELGWKCEKPAFPENIRLAWKEWSA